MDLIIGTYTEQLPHVRGKADGVLTARFDPVSGRIGPVTSLAAARNPSYLATRPRASTSTRSMRPSTSTTPSRAAASPPTPATRAPGS